MDDEVNERFKNPHMSKREFKDEDSSRLFGNDFVDVISFYLRKSTDRPLVSHFAFKIGKRKVLERMQHESEVHLVMKSILLDWKGDDDATEENLIRHLSEHEELRGCANVLRRGGLRKGGRMRQSISLPEDDTLQRNESGKVKRLGGSLPLQEANLDDFDDYGDEDEESTFDHSSRFSLSTHPPTRPDSISDLLDITSSMSDSAETQTTDWRAGPSHMFPSTRNTRLKRSNSKRSNQSAEKVFSDGALPPPTMRSHQQAMTTPSSSGSNADLRIQRADSGFSSRIRRLQPGYDVSDTDSLSDMAREVFDIQDKEEATFDPNKIIKKEIVKNVRVILNESKVPLPGDGNTIAKLQQEMDQQKQEMELLKFQLNEMRKQISEKETTQEEPKR